MLRWRSEFPIRKDCNLISHSLAHAASYIRRADYADWATRGVSAWQEGGWTSRPSATKRCIIGAETGTVVITERCLCQSLILSFTSPHPEENRSLLGTYFTSVCCYEAPLEMARCV